MFELGIVFLVIALIAMLLGQQGVAGLSKEIGITLIIVAVILLVLGSLHEPMFRGWPRYCP